MNFGFSILVSAWNVIGSAWRTWRYLLKHGLLVLLGLLVAQPWVYGETVRFDADIKLFWDEYRKVSVEMQAGEAHVLTTGICGEILTDRANVPQVPFAQELDLNAAGNCPHGRSWFLDKEGQLFLDEEGKSIEFTPNGRLQRRTINYSGYLTLYAATNYNTSCPSLPCLTTASIDFFEATPYQRDSDTIRNHTFSVNAGQGFQEIKRISIADVVNLEEPRVHKAWPTHCSASSSNSRIQLICQPKNGNQFIVYASAEASHAQQDDSAKCSPTNLGAEDITLKSSNADNRKSQDMGFLPADELEYDVPFAWVMPTKDTNDNQ